MPQDADHITGMTGNDSLRPREDNDQQVMRATKAGNAMFNRYKKDRNAHLLDTAIELLRKALSLGDAGHPNRAFTCSALGLALSERYRQTGDVVLLDEAIELKREALALRPPGHPKRASTCASLASSLHVRFQQNGNSALLEEAIEHAREALALRPLGHPDRSKSCSGLGSLLRERCQQTGDIALLDQAIELEREALSLQPPGHPDRSNSCGSLACSLSLHYKRTGDDTLLIEVMQLQREALSLRPLGHPTRASTCGNLGFSLRVLFKQNGDITLLDEAIELQREALALQPPGCPDRPFGFGNLGLSLRMRYEQTGDVAMLDEAIELEREALALQPPGHLDRADSCAILGSSLRVLFKQNGDVALLDEAIELERETLSLRPSGHPIRSKCCANLATSLSLRYKQTGNDTLLDEAIELEREALSLRPPGHPDRSNSCDNLACLLSLHYKRTGDEILLNEVMQLQREVLALHPLGHPDRAHFCANLASVHRACYTQTGDVALLDEATKLGRETLALQPSGHSSRANGCSSLAASLYERYVQTSDVAMLDEAIKLEREALTLLPPGHIDRANCCANLGSSLRVRYKRTGAGDDALLNEVIKLNREALALLPPGHTDRANGCANLGSSLHVRYRCTGDDALLEEAIKLQREALALQPPGHPDRALSCTSLAASLSLRYEQTGDIMLLNEALDICNAASKHCSPFQVWFPLTWLSNLHLVRDNPHYSVLKALEYLDRSFQHEVEDIPTFILNVCINVRLIWNDCSIQSPHIIALLVDVYAKIVDRLPLVAGFVLDTSSRLETLKSTREVGPDACMAALLAEQPATAVTILDRAHGVVWSQALHQRDPQMEGAPKDLTLELEDLLRAIAASALIDPTSVANHPQDLRHRQNARIQAILREIRAKPGLSRFMLGSTYETLREAARDHPVVVLVGARDHAFALVIPNSSDASPDILRLHVATHDLRSLADTAGRANLRYRAGLTEHRRAEASGQEISHAELTEEERAMRAGNFDSDWSPLAILWHDVVKPVLMSLHFAKEEDPRRRSRLHWCTAGQFASIPIHAAGIYTGEDQECCSDYIVSSYTPTLATLLRARKGLKPITTAEAKLLLVAVEHTADTRLPSLSKVKAEMRDICSVVEKAGVQYAASSQSVSKTAQATAALPSATLVHIACHGLQDPAQPLNSAFHLGDDDVLSVSALMKLDLKGAFLAFLSACETAKGDRDQPDQAIHLAATMLFVGFKSVVATMWAMRDEDGPIVSKAFYEKLLKGDTITADAVPYALDHAVRKLRESGAPVGSWATFIHVGA